LPLFQWGHLQAWADFKASGGVEKQSVEAWQSLGRGQSFGFGNGAGIWVCLKMGSPQVTMVVSIVNLHFW